MSSGEQTDFKEHLFSKSSRWAQCVGWAKVAGQAKVAGRVALMAHTPAGVQVRPDPSPCRAPHLMPPCGRAPAASILRRRQD